MILLRACELPPSPSLPPSHLHAPPSCTYCKYVYDDMLQCRQEALEKVNKMFGTNITVEKNSSWDNKSRESEAEIKSMENEANGEEEPSNENTEMDRPDSD